MGSPETPPTQHPRNLVSPSFGSYVLQQRGGAVDDGKNCNFLSSFFAATAASASGSGP